MVGKLHAINRDLYVRRCVVCGYDGALLRGGMAERCARCGCDLTFRRPRSYAEMEGLIGEPLILDEPRTDRRREARCIQRWLAFLFMSMMGMLLLAYLFASAMP